MNNDKCVYIKYNQLFFSYIKPDMLTIDIINKYSDITTVSKRGDIDDVVRNVIVANNKKK